MKTKIGGVVIEFDPFGVWGSWMMAVGVLIPTMIVFVAMHWLFDYSYIDSVLFAAIVEVGLVVGWPD